MAAQAGEVIVNFKNCGTLSFLGLNLPFDTRLEPKIDYF